LPEQHQHQQDGVEIVNQRISFEESSNNSSNKKKK